MAILKAYELVPEAYRQKFQTFRKRENQTFVEFAHEKETYFDRWCSAKQVGHEFDRLRQVILVEEFKRSVRDDIKVHLDEQNVQTLAKAASMADDYALTHKNHFGRNKNNGSSKSNSFGGKNPPGNVLRNSPSAQNSQASSQSDSMGKKPTKSFIPTCGHCGKRGHVMSDCWSLKRKKENQASPNAFISCKPNCLVPKEVDNGEASAKTEEIRPEFQPFISEGSVSIDKLSGSVPIMILRDTGATQSLLLEGVLPLDLGTSTGEEVIAQGIEGGFVNVPLHRIYLKSNLISGPVVVGTRPTLPIKGVALLLGNDLAGGRVIANPKVTSKPVTLENVEKLEEDSPGLFPSCAVTRAMAKKAAEEPNANKQSEDILVDLSETFLANTDIDTVKNPTDKTVIQTENPNKEGKDSPLSRAKLIEEQEKDPDLAPLFQLTLPKEELDKVATGYYVNNGILMRKWRPPKVPSNEEWSVLEQIVVPKVYHGEILKLAHESPMGGHLGINKTLFKITRHFYWPKIRQSVVEFCRTCHSCQVVGKPNQTIPKAPLKPIPAFEEPFSRVIIDCVGPLPKTKARNEYILTIMCAATRFPEAIPLSNIGAPKISKALTKFFTLVGLPKEIQSDQGSNFMSHLFQQVVYQLGAKQIKSSAYHPESQGALERFHSTLKNMIRTYCFEHEKDWDEGLDLLMFAVRESYQESLGFSPFELVFGHTVRGPLKLVKETWLSENPPNLHLLDYVERFRGRLKLELSY